MASKNRRIFELRLGKLGLLLFICGMSLLLFSSFLIGVVIGKHMEAYPERYSSGLTELIRDRLLMARTKAGEKGAQEVKEEKFGLTFYETLGGDKGAATVGGRNGEVKDKKSEDPAGQIAPSAALPETKRPAPIPDDAVSKARSAAPPDDGGPVKQAPSEERTAGEAGLLKSSDQPGRGRFEIQAAAYREKQQAEQLVKKLKNLGFSPHIVMKELSHKGTWFRVIVPGFESREKAKETAGEMAGKIRGLNCVIRTSGNSGN